jgi:hypothetical protein
MVLGVYPLHAVVAAALAAMSLVPQLRQVVGGDLAT